MVLPIDIIWNTHLVQDMFQIRDRVRLIRNIPELNLPAGLTGQVMRIHPGIKGGEKCYEVAFEYPRLDPIIVAMISEVDLEIVN